MSKHTIIKGNCVVEQRESLFCAGLLWQCSCSSSSLLWRRHSRDWQLYFPPSSFSLGEHSLPPVNSIFIILEKPGGKKHALRCFHISRRRSVVFVAKNMLKYHRVFLLLLSLFHLQPAALRWQQTLAGMVSLCLRAQLCPAWLTGSVQDLWQGHHPWKCSPTPQTFGIRLSGKEDIDQKLGFNHPGGLFQP